MNPTDEAADSRGRFLSLVSHEFRTPLTVILSSTELLESYGETMPAQRRLGHYRRIQGAVATMTSLLDNVSLLSRIDEGRFEPSCETFHVGRALAAILEEAEAFRRPGQEISLECDQEILWTGDLRLVRACTANLLANALRYSPEGTVCLVQARLEGRSLVIEILDRGSGILPQELEKVWEPFARGSSAAGTGGSGLGLAIVRRCLDLASGEARLEPRPDGGTRAILRLTGSETP